MHLLKLNAGNILRQQTSSLTENLRIVVQRLRYIFKFSAGEPQDIGYPNQRDPLVEFTKQIVARLIKYGFP
jgi:hypothetical protein